MTSPAVSARSGVGHDGTLHVKILSQLPDPFKVLLFENVASGCTVLQLKNLIRDRIPQRPLPSSQRLIYRGHVLAQDSETLESIFGKESSARQTDAVHVLHVVIRETDTGRGPQILTRNSAPQHPNPIQAGTPLRVNPILAPPSVVASATPAHAQHQSSAPAMSAFQQQQQQQQQWQEQQRQQQSNRSDSNSQPAPPHQQLPQLNPLHVQAGVFHAPPYIANTPPEFYPVTQQFQRTSPRQYGPMMQQTQPVGYAAANGAAERAAHMHLMNQLMLDQVRHYENFRQHQQQTRTEPSPLHGPPGQLTIPTANNGVDTVDNNAITGNGGTQGSTQNQEHPRPFVQQGITPQGIRWTTTFHTGMPLNQATSLDPGRMIPHWVPPPPPPQFHRHQNLTATSGARPDAHTTPSSQQTMLNTPTELDRSTNVSSNDPRHIPTSSREDPAASSSSNNEIPQTQRVADQNVTAYVLYSPDGPRALLMTPEGRYESVPRVVPSMQFYPQPHYPLARSFYPYSYPSASTFGALQGRTHNTVNPGSSDPSRSTDTGATRPEQTTVQNQDSNAAQQNQARPRRQAVRGQLQQMREENQADDLAQAMRPAFRAIWILVRIFGFIWFFTSGSSSRRMFLLVAASLAFWATQTGIFGDRLERLRQYWEELIGHPPTNAIDNNNTTGVEANGATDANGVQRVATDTEEQHGHRHRDPDERENRRLRRRLERGRLDPQVAADRLLHNHREADRGQWRERMRPAERALALFIASLYPGVGERHVAARERLNREAVAAAVAVPAAPQAEVEVGASRTQEAENAIEQVSATITPASGAVASEKATTSSTSTAAASSSAVDVHDSNNKSNGTRRRHVEIEDADSSSSGNENNDDGEDEDED